MMNDSLQDTLRSLIQSGWQANPAMRTLINDYVKYHAAFVIAGGLFTLILVSLSRSFWIKFKNTTQFKWTFEKKVYCSVGLLSGLVALLMALIVAVNLMTTLNPLQGFSLLIDELTPSSRIAPLHQAYQEWIQSGSSTPPTLVEQHIHRRVMFHTTRATVGGILLILFTGLSIHFWSTLVRRRTARSTKWRLKEQGLFVIGIATIALSLLTMIIVAANTQGIVAPITLTLLFG